MPIDINLLRPEKGGDVSAVTASEASRFRPTKAVEDTVELDIKWRQSLFTLENTRKVVSAYQKHLSALYKAAKTGDKAATPENTQAAELLENYKKNADSPLPEATTMSATQISDLLACLKSRIASLEVTVGEIAANREKILRSIGNMVHPTVPIANDEANNQVIKTWNLPTFLNPNTSLPIDAAACASAAKEYLHHHQILAKLGGFDMKKGSEIAGHRGYFLKGCGVLLNMALVNYGLNFLIKKGYVPVQPPYFMKKEVMLEAAELKDFHETLYYIPHNPTAAPAASSVEGVTKEEKSKKEEKDEGSRDDMYLIATSEQPLCALHRGESIPAKALPIRYAGFSTCFRKEAGSHGKDTWGVFRVHQFEKVEQFCITSPEKSWEMHEEMLKLSEEFYQSLDIPYRVISIVSGALNDAAAKKYDLEAWFPGYGEFKELVSCSNCTDYQARELEVRLGYKAGGNMEKKFVHMLNGTLVASERCMCCILENYQTEGGVKVPRVLVPYVGEEFLKYVE